MGINCILSGQIVDQSQTKVAGYVEEQTATAGQTQFIIGLETFDNTTDELWVYSGITTLSPVSDYTVVGRIITLKEGVPEGRSITIRVLQNVLTDGTQLVSGAQIVDGTIPLEKLSVDVITREELGSIDLTNYATVERANEIEAKIPTKTSQLTNDSGYLTSISKADIGLGNVDNTSDANKPISTAQAARINAVEAKIPSITISTTDLSAGVSSLANGTIYLVYS